MHLRLIALCVVLFCLAIVTGQNERERFNARVPRPRGPSGVIRPSTSTGTRPDRGGAGPSSSSDQRKARADQAILQRKQESQRPLQFSAGGSTRPGPLQIQRAPFGNRQQSAGHGSGTYTGPGGSLVINGKTYFPIDGKYFIEGYWYIICGDYLIPELYYTCCSDVHYPLKDGIECCGTNYYEPATEICCDNSRWYKAIDPDYGSTAVCCGETYYVPAFEICCGGNFYDKSVYECCAGSPFNKGTHCCDQSAIKPTGTCGCRNTALVECCDGQAHSRRFRHYCCGTRYIPRTYGCCGKKPYPLDFGYQCCLDTNAYLPDLEECCAGGRVVTRPQTCASDPNCTPGGDGHVYYRKK